MIKCPVCKKGGIQWKEIKHKDNIPNYIETIYKGKCSICNKRYKKTEKVMGLQNSI